MVCPDCGMDIEKGEKYCIRCGTSISKKINQTKQGSVDTDTGLQVELSKIFHSNKILSFILRYSVVFVIIYPIYTLMGRFDIFDSIYEKISNYTIILYYVYNFGLLAAYTNKRFKALFGALALRVLNSVILVFQSESPWQSIFRISVILVSAIFVYRKLMTDSQRSSLNGNIKTEDVYCSQCGSHLKASDIFCHQCGNRM